jgi:hypothetical protein
MKIIKGLVETNHLLKKGRKFWVDWRNPSRGGFMIGKKFEPFSGGLPLDPNEMAAHFMRLGLKDFARAVSPKSSIASLISLLSKNKSEEIREAVAKNLKRRGISEKDLEPFMHLTGKECDKAIAALEKLRKKGIPEVEIMQVAAQSANKSIRLIAAESTFTPEEDIIGFAQDREPEVVVAAINNLWDRGSIGEKLNRMMETVSQSQFPNIRLIAAGASITTKEVLSNVAKKDKSHTVLVAVIENLRQRNIPEPEIMSLAARSVYLGMKEMAAASAQTPEDLLFGLAGNDFHPEVSRAAIANLRRRGIGESLIMSRISHGRVDFAPALMAARSPHTPESSLLSMLRRGGENSSSVSAALIRTARAAIENLVSRGHKEANIMKNTMAGNSRCHLMRGIAAESSATPVDSLLYLVATDGLAAKKAIANLRERGVDEALIMSHAVRNPDSLGRRFALLSGATPAEELLKLIKGDYFKSPRGYGGDEPDLIIAGLRKRKVPEAEIMRAAGESRIFSRSLKRIAAKSAETPFDTLYKLEGDENREIAQAAETTMNNLANRCYDEKGEGSAEIMRVLGRSLDPKRRLFAAESSLTPNDLLYYLAEDKNPEVARAAQKTLVGLIEG